ncbi:hypothetical protein NL676_038383 [Syzygium grande]|nr:hypothetical protein NL676_038383 [Syzygium grande]
MPPLSPPKPLSRFPSRPNPRKRPAHDPGPPCLARPLLDLCSRGRLADAVGSLRRLALGGVRLPSQVLARLIRQCGAAGSLKQGKHVHLHLKLTGLKRPGTFLANRLIEMYFRCNDEVAARKVFDEMPARNVYSWNSMLSGYARLGRMNSARRLFEKMPERDVVSWNTMVMGYVRCGCCDEAVRLYRELRRSGIECSEFSFAGILTVCVKLKDLCLSKQIHGQVLVYGYSSNAVIVSTVVDAYAKCGEMSDARRAFDGMRVKDVLAWTTLVSGYAKWGDMEAAMGIFDQMPEKNAVSWTALIAGYARNGLGDIALKSFSEMIKLHLKPDQFTFSSSLCACASMASLKQGKQIHGFLIRTCFKPNTIVVCSLIDMYSKCGLLSSARLVFDLVGDKNNVVLWNTMISALAQHGQGKGAIEMFDDMIRLGIKPDKITLLVIVNACSHSGLPKEGLQLFDSITHDHGISPDQEHYACMIDLLGRAGLFDEVINRIRMMPFPPDERIWNALLCVCKIHCNLALGKEAAEHLLELQPSSPDAYVFLSSVYASLGKWKLVEEVRKLMHDRCVTKDRAVSWIETDSKVHSFSIADDSHPSKEEICSMLDQIAIQMEENKLRLDTQ